MAAPPLRPSVAGIAYRTATPDDLVACAGIWRDSINDYTRRLNQPDIPDDLAAILRLYDHLQATDPGGFVVAEQAVDGGPPAVVAFTASYRREDLWYLSMLFVLPEVQALGLGRALLAKVMPPRRAARRSRHPRTASSRSRTGCTRRSGSRPGCRSSGSSGWCSGTATCRTCRAA